MKESAYCRKLRAKLEAIPRSYWIRIEQKSIRGTPDLIGVINGIFIALEVKRNEKESRKGGRQVLQNYVLTKLQDAGAYGCMVYPENEEKVLRALNSIAYSEYVMALDHVDPYKLN